MGSFLRGTLFIFLCLFSLVGRTQVNSTLPVFQEPVTIDDTNEDKIEEQVRLRAYTGGRDESDLAIQGQLVNPTRKMTPAFEDAVEESESNSRD